MPTNQQAIRVYVTDEQATAVRELISIYGEKSAAELIRKLLAEACTRHDIQWQDNPVSWGGKRRGNITD